MNEATDTTAPAHVLEGWTVTAPHKSPWQPVSPGIMALPLNQRALLVVFEPGALWDGMDVHAEGPEELVILDGVLELGIPGARNTLVTAGGRVRAEQGTRHQPRAGVHGCRLLAHYPSS